MKLETLNKIVPDKGTTGPALSDYDGKEVHILAAAVESTGRKTRKGEDITEPYVYLKNGASAPTKVKANASIVEMVQRRFEALDSYLAEHEQEARRKNDAKIFVEALKAAELPSPLPENRQDWRYFTVKVEKLQRGVRIA